MELVEVELVEVELLVGIGDGGFGCMGWRLLEELEGTVRDRVEFDLVQHAVQRFVVVPER